MGGVQNESSTKLQSMTRQEAFEIFQLEEPIDADNVSDAYEESFFTIRDYFLKNTVVPQLFVSRLQRLKKFEQAFCVLQDQPLKWEEPKLPSQPDHEEAMKIMSLKSSSLEELLKSYEGRVTEKRMFIAQSWTIPEVVKNTLELVAVQQAYHLLFEEFGQAEFTTSKEMVGEVKAAEQIDSGVLLKKLKSRSESDEANLDFQHSLGKELARVKKLNKLLRGA